MLEVLHDPYIISSAAVVAATAFFSVAALALSPVQKGHTVEYQKRARAIARRGIQVANMADQDTDAVFAMQHVTQAIAYLEIAMQLSSETKTVSGVDVHALVEMLKKRQTKAVDSLR